MAQGNNGREWSNLEEVTILLSAEAAAELRLHVEATIMDLDDTSVVTGLMFEDKTGWTTHALLGGSIVEPLLKGVARGVWGTGPANVRRAAEGGGWGPHVTDR